MEVGERLMIEKWRMYEIVMKRVGGLVNGC